MIQSRKNQNYVFEYFLHMSVLVIDCYWCAFGEIQDRFDFFSIHDSTEVAIQKMIDASQGIITMGSQGELGGMSLPMKKHWELEIKILQNAPRDADKLERLLQVKQKQKDEAMHMEETQRLVTEIEMLKVVMYQVCRKKRE